MLAEVALGIVFYICYVEIQSDGKYLKWMQTLQKHSHVGMIAVLALGLYVLWKWMPHQRGRIRSHAMQLVQSKSPMMQTIIHEFSPYWMDPVQSTPTHTSDPSQSTNQGGRTFKRVVSETKKKYVAALQNWNCEKCRDRLDHTFEIDHRVRLENGGTNEVDNLVALCRTCHGHKTAMENM